MAHLVKAEIVPAYHGILINMGVGNPTVSFARSLGNRRALRPVRRRSIFIAFIKGYSPVFLPHAYHFLRFSSLKLHCPGLYFFHCHRLPAKGQVIPTPKSGERVVFISHFLRGLGFALHPFVRGLIFYYGLDFHDLALDSFLHISAFIVMCEAFLRIPHTSAYG